VRLGSGPLSRASGGKGGPCHISLASTPRPSSSSWAASMSETTSVPSAEPGEAYIDLELHFDSRSAGAGLLFFHVGSDLAANRAQPSAHHADYDAERALIVT